MCKLLIITNCGAKEAPIFEKNAKEIYLTGSSKLCLVFIHKDILPHTIAEKTKQKKPSAVIFNDDVPLGKIASTKDGVERRKITTRFIHIGPRVVMHGIETMPDHLAVRLALLN